MSGAWQYQVRIGVSAALAENLRGTPGGSLAVQEIVRRHSATLVCQFDAFADYVNEAERERVEAYPLYRWTKETIEQPEKKAKYLRSFTVHVAGQEIYDKTIADALQRELSALIDHVDLLSVVTIDTNPANNPQPPRQ